MNLRNVIIFFAIIAVSILVLTLQANREYIKLKTKDQLKSVPNNVFEQVSYIAMDEQGKPYFHTKTPKMQQYENSETIDIDYPEITLYSQNTEKPPTFIVAERARFAYKREKIRLNGKVYIDYKQSAKKASVVMKTEEMYIYLKDRLALSDTDVKISRKNQLLKGKGMKASLKEGEFILLENTSGFYEQ